ncbi:MAG: hypothetical protein V4485_00175 [Pseudomonadota bacterium]
MHSKVFYDYCVWNDEESALWALNSFSDIDTLYDNGGIIRSICTKHNITLLKALIHYFENTQFSDKEGEKYKEAHSKLVEILDEASEYASPEMNRVISEYLGLDIALLDDVPDEDHDPAWQETPTQDPSKQGLTERMLIPHNIDAARELINDSFDALSASDTSSGLSVEVMGEL